MAETLLQMSRSLRLYIPQLPITLAEQSMEFRLAVHADGPMPAEGLQPARHCCNSPLVIALKVVTWLE